MVLLYNDHTIIIIIIIIIISYWSRRAAPRGAEATRRGSPRDVGLDFPLAPQEGAPAGPRRQTLRRPASHFDGSCVYPALPAASVHFLYFCIRHTWPDTLCCIRCYWLAWSHGACSADGRCSLDGLVPYHSTAMGSLS